MRRSISMFIRKLQSGKTERRTLQRFNEWRNQLQQFVPATSQIKKLLIIRLDDIGDYILFRNSLAAYKNAERWKDHQITLLGNEAWRSLFDFFDTATTDNTIWINKRKYLDDEAYRLSVWKQLADEGFDTVICPSRTHPLLLDDLCAAATGAANKISTENTYPFQSWNTVSDSIYNEVYKPANNNLFEFFFNNQFANWCCGTNISLQRPTFSKDLQPVLQGNYIVCFIGAATNSKRWPARRWIEFIQLFRKEFSLNPVLCGGGNEAAMAVSIQAGTGADNLVNKFSLPEMVALFQHATLIISNNTMAAHMAASCNKPTLIIANGDGYARFTEYERAGIQNVQTIYPKIFLRKFNAGQANPLHYTAVTADIAGIKANDVLQKISHMLTNKQ